MKPFLFPLFFFFASTVSAQAISKEDIAFKAKLLTVFRSGIASQEAILADISGQELQFLTNDSSRIVMMKIKFSQHYLRGETTSTTVLGDCFYIVAYNQELLKFYRLAGFDSSDAREFFAELNSGDFIMLTFEDRITKEIDLVCLSAESRKRSFGRKKSKCATDCTTTLSNYLKIH